MQIQSTAEDLISQFVVICFKFSNFAYANTVFITSCCRLQKLLFALNLVTLLMQIQYEFNKILIQNALQRCCKNKKRQKKFSLLR